MDAIANLFSRFFNSVWFRVLTVVVIGVIVFYAARAVYKRVCRGLINTVSYTRQFSTDGAFEGETVTLTETIHNRALFPIIFVDIWGYIFNDLRVEGMEFDEKKAMQPFSGRFAMLMPYMQLKRTHTIILKKRGFYKLEGVEMLISDSHRYIESPASIYVYPAPLNIQTVPVTRSMLRGESRSLTRLMSDPFNVSGVRDYVFGDPFNSINFNATAKSGGLAGRGIKVNSCDFVSDRTIMIYVNFRTDTNDPIPTRFYNAIVERMLGAISRLVCEARELGFRLGLAANCINADNTNRLRFPVYSGEAHFRDILRALSLVRPAAGVSFTGMLDEDISRGIYDTEIYVFTLYDDPSVAERIRVLKQMGNSVTSLIFEKENEED